MKRKRSLARTEPGSEPDSCFSPLSTFPCASGRSRTRPAGPASAADPRSRCPRHRSSRSGPFPVPSWHSRRFPRSTLLPSRSFLRRMRFFVCLHEITRNQDENKTSRRELVKGDLGGSARAGQGNKDSRILSRMGSRSVSRPHFWRPYGSRIAANCTDCERTRSTRCGSGPAAENSDRSLAPPPRAARLHSISTISLRASPITQESLQNSVRNLRNSRIYSQFA